MKLIDKSALVAEINRNLRICAIMISQSQNENCVELYKQKAEVYQGMLSFLDTLEVKEVDLEKEYKDFVEEDPVYNKLVNGIVGKAIAKHFFELGLKTKRE